MVRATMANLACWIGGMALAVLLTGCGGEQETDGAGGAETGEGDADDVRTFSPSVDEAGSDLQERAPDEGRETILVPSTELIPGSARVVPDMDNPFSGDAEAIAAGERHFAAFNCAGCHAPLGGGGMGPPLSDDNWIYGEEPAQIYLSIMHGRPEGMPSWASMLPEDTVWEMVAYIETLDEIDDYAAQKGFEDRPPTPAEPQQSGQ